MGIHHLYVVWMLILYGHVCSAEVTHLQKNVGESAVIGCSFPPELGALQPYAVRLKRCWLRRDQVTFMHMGEEAFSPDQYKSRIKVTGGDPSIRQVNVSLSELRASDTDRYCCEFLVAASSEDRVIPGTDEFFIYVPNDGPFDVVNIDTCAGGSAVVPCARPPGEAAVEGFSVVRWKSSGPVEVLYHSKYHEPDGHQQHLSSTTDRLPPSSSSSSPFPADRLRLTTAFAAGGVAYNLTLLHLQPAESGYYACTLLPAGRPQASAGLGPWVFYVSVQGGQCGCSGYTTLLYALFAAVAMLLLLLMLVVFWARRRTPVKPQAQVPIYEEMVGVRQPKPKLGAYGLGTLHLDEVEVSGEYSNSLLTKPRAENHYESPSLARINQG